jgi:hypothetical protein
MKPQYLAIWGQGYIDQGQPAKTKKVSLDFFTDGRGYNDEEVIKLCNLSIGETWPSRENGYHSIVRIS